MYTYIPDIVFFFLIGRYCVDTMPRYGIMINLMRNVPFQFKIHVSLLNSHLPIK